MQRDINNPRAGFLNQLEKKRDTSEHKVHSGKLIDWRHFRS